MLVDRFRKLAEEFQERETALLDHKRDEYASQEADVLENFATLGLLLHRRPEQIAATLLAKHVQAILKQVEDDAYTWAWETPKGEGLKQRISDARNYLLLLAACIDERKVLPERGPRTAEEMDREISDYIGHDLGYAVVKLGAGAGAFTRVSEEVESLEEARGRAWSDGYLAGATAARAALAAEKGEAT